MQNITPNNEEKILKIIHDRGEDIYTKKEFIALIMDYFPNDDFGRLLKAIIEKNGAVYVSKLKQYSGNELQVNYIKVLNKLADETFIPKQVLTPAVDLLCFGLSLAIQTPVQQPLKKVPIRQPVEATNSASFSTSDFEIENGVLKKYIGNGGLVLIPNSVTEIKMGSFKGCSCITEVIIPNSVTSINDAVFVDCSSLTKVTIPNSVTYIGAFAFLFCRSLTQVIIPNSVTFIGEFAFKNCSSLTQVIIPNSLTSIGTHAFYCCSKLPENVRQQIKSINSTAIH